MRKLLLTIMIVALGCSLFAAFDAKKSDDLFYHEEAYEADRDYLLSSLDNAETDSEKAAILWRLSRTTLYITDGIDKDDKDARIAGYEESEAYADQSIAIEETPNAYHWKASAIGRIGQVNGPLNSLSKAKPMRSLIEKVQNEFNADMSDAWYVISLLYDQLPGAPIFSRVGASSSLVSI